MSYAPSLYSNSSSLSRLPSETMPSSQHPCAIFKRPSSYRSQNMSPARSDQPVYRTSRTSSIPEASRRSQRRSSARLTPRDTYADGPRYSTASYGLSTKSNGSRTRPYRIQKSIMRDNGTSRKTLQSRKRKRNGPSKSRSSRSFKRSEEADSAWRHLLKDPAYLQLLDDPTYTETLSYIESNLAPSKKQLSQPKSDWTPEEIDAAWQVVNSMCEQGYEWKDSTDQ